MHSVVLGSHREQKLGYSELLLMSCLIVDRFTSGPKSSARNPSDDDSLDSPVSASGDDPTFPHWGPLEPGRGLLEISAV